MSRTGRFDFNLPDDHDNPSEEVLVVLPLTSIPIVGGVCQVLEWDASWENDTDSDDIHQYAIDIEKRIGGFLMLSDVLDRLDVMNGHLSNLSHLERLQCLCAQYNLALTQQGIEELQGAGREWGNDDNEFRQGIGTPPPAFTDWTEYDAAKCELASSHYNAAFGYLTHVVTQAPSVADVLIDWFDTALVVFYGTGIPLSVAYEFLSRYLINGPAVEADQLALATVGTMKEDLICAFVQSENAYEAAQAYVELLPNYIGDLTPFTALLLGIFYTFPMLTLRYQDKLTRPIGTTESELCAECALQSGTSFLWQWPPCPGDQFLGGGTCTDGRKGVEATDGQIIQEFIVENDGELFNVGQMDLQVTFRSKWPTGWTAGLVTVQSWDDVGLSWVNAGSVSTHTSAPPGQDNISFATLTYGEGKQYSLWRAIITADHVGGPPFGLEVMEISIVMTEWQPS